MLGFWRLAAAGGRPKAPLGDHDPCQLLQAEAVVNVLTGHGSQVHVTDADRDAAVVRLYCRQGGSASGHERGDDRPGVGVPGQGRCSLGGPTTGRGPAAHVALPSS